MSIRTGTTAGVAGGAGGAGGAALLRRHRTRAELEAGLDAVRGSPADAGRIERIVLRPAIGEREPVDQVRISTDVGVEGDGWLARGSARMPDGSADREAQVTLMNSRFAALVAGAPEAWDQAGDQLYVDLDLGVANLPPGTRLALGSALVEVSEVPHTGCARFSTRFGPEALRIVSTPVGRAMRLRGVNTRVIEAGEVRVGDQVRRV